jgi:hypothetical protein
MRKGIRHGGISHAIHAARCVKHGSKADGAKYERDPKFCRPILTVEAAIEDSLGTAHVTPKFHNPTFDLYPEATRRPIVNTQSTLRCTSTATATVVDTYPNSRPEDLRPMKQGTQIVARLEAETMTVKAIATRIGQPVDNVKAMLNNPEGDFRHYVKSASSRVPMIVASEVLTRYEFPITAQLAPEDSTKPMTAEEVLAMEHLSHNIGGRACQPGSGCLQYECTCGAHWIGHSLMSGCNEREHGARWGCPVVTAARALIAA